MVIAAAVEMVTVVKLVEGEVKAGAMRVVSEAPVWVVALRGLALVEGAGALVMQEAGSMILSSEEMIALCMRVGQGQLRSKRYTPR